MPSSKPETAWLWRNHWAFRYQIIDAAVATRRLRHCFWTNWLWVGYHGNHSLHALWVFWTKDFLTQSICLISYFGDGQPYAQGHAQSVSIPSSTNKHGKLCLDNGSRSRIMGYPLA
jgi:hypothetical protein